MNTFFDALLTTVLVVVLTVLIVFLPLFAYKSAVTNAELWNRCFPESQITVAEAFWSRVRIDQCRGKI